MNISHGDNLYLAHFITGVDEDGCYIIDNEYLSNGSHTIEVLNGTVIFFELHTYEAICNVGKILWKNNLMAYQLPQSNSEPIILNIEFD